MSENIQNEIDVLEQQLAEKRASLESGSAETGQEIPHEKEILREVVGEKIQQYSPSYLPAGRQGQPAPASPDGDDQPSYAPELAEKVQELVNLAFSKSIDDAIKDVVKSGNPALVDAFHDTLVDQLYDTLIERKKLEPVK